MRGWERMPAHPAQAVAAAQGDTIINEAPSPPVVIVPNDTHIGPRLVEDLRPYCPKQHLDEFDRFHGSMNLEPIPFIADTRQLVPQHRRRARCRLVARV